jgi:hypothetical protein
VRTSPGGFSPRGSTRAPPYCKAGKHRRVRRDGSLNDKVKIDRKREAALDRLVADAQEQGMGYGRP